MATRPPSDIDLKRVKKALAYVTAYDFGTETGEFESFIELLHDEDDPAGMTQALAQFAWMLLNSLDEMGPAKQQVLNWYGVKFAVHQEELRK